MDLKAQVKMAVFLAGSALATQPAFAQAASDPSPTMNTHMRTNVRNIFEIDPASVDNKGEVTEAGHQKVNEFVNRFKMVRADTIMHSSNGEQQINQTFTDGENVLLAVIAGKPNGEGGISGQRVSYLLSDGTTHVNLTQQSDENNFRSIKRAGVTEPSVQDWSAFNVTNALYDGFSTLRREAQPGPSVKGSTLKIK